MSEMDWGKYGLSESNGRLITEILFRFGSVEEAILFGSRAKGNYKNGSDVDIALKGDVSKDTLSSILSAFESSVLPYFVDIVLYDRLESKGLKEHIDRVGIVINLK